ncbi:acyl-CoA dehydrogenase family protein [Nocardia ninae]|uniref:Acyl-CoA dehydrogenase n=1 Tax=Nocardia ninae NBRC 108245 TaxID=1210091 RepID=A0A511MSR1_9NOCA|nr:acyl-CoA dehydrogenase family protein [Nocardia ninae]GEM43481.1 acyl-CoA dehydrogenase [Nocardia ninae NBRC 108245]
MRTEVRRPAFDPDILALPFYDRTHRALAESVDRWCAEQGALWARARTDASDSSGASIIRELGAAGWLAGLDPAAGAGAPGLDWRGLCLMREILAYSEDLADYAFSVQALAATPIRRHGSAEQQARWLPPMSRGEAIGAFALSEDQAGSDVAAIELRAENHSSGYLLNGHKAWIANGTLADVFCVIARTGGLGAFGLTAFLVPAGTPGLRTQPIDMVAPRSLARVEFEDCYVPADAVLGGLGGGFILTMDLLERFRMTVGAAAVGFARRAADAALDHARGRKAYGATLFDLPTVRASLADAEVALNAAALLVARAAWDADHSAPHFARQAGIAKLYATENAQVIVDAAVQIRGASGLVTDSLTERLYRQIRSLRLYEGASEVLRATIAETLGHRTASAGPVPAESGAAHAGP